MENTPSTFPARGIPAGRRTARAARTPPRSLLISRSGLDPLEAAVAAKRVASEAVRDALTDIGAGPGPVDALGIAARRGSAAGNLGPLA